MPTLHWIGKEKVINHHQDVPYRILEKQYTFRGGEERQRSSENKIIHGDNLEVLKSLLPEYEGRIKCIYIDPPYNTGNEGWVYNDNVNDPKIKKWLGQVVGKESEDLTRHDKWLCMMYPRLKLLHKLLADDGVIFISIDDSEYSSMRIMVDEIFGKLNFIGNFCHKSRHSVSNDLLVSQNHHYLISFSKNFNEVFKAKTNFRLPQEYKGFKNPDNDPRGPYKLVPVDGPGGSRKGNPYYEFKGVLGYWRYSEETMQKLYDNGEIIVRANSLSRKYYLDKAKLKGGMTPTTWWDDAGTATDGTKLLKEIFHGEKVFDTPKPITFLEKICNLGLWGKNPIILDSFAGSGTTAHAVLNLNKQDGGNRKFILVEMEDYADSITAERVKRVIKGYGEGNKAVEGTGGDFSYYELGQPLFDQDELLNEEVSSEKIREYVWYTETKTPYHRQEEEYLLGVKSDTAYYLYYEKNELTGLDESFLRRMKTRAGQYIIYADLCLLDRSLMDKYGIIFKKIPRDISRF